MIKIKVIRPKYLFFVFLSLLFWGCKSVPVDFNEKIANTLPLDGGASVYILADAKEGIPLLELLPISELESSLTNNKQVRQIIDKTDFFAIAVFPQESERHIQIAGFGNYPSRMAGLGFAFSKHWKRQHSNQSSDKKKYWYSTAGNYSIAINSNQVLVSSHRTDMPKSPYTDTLGTPPPEGFAEFLSRTGSHQSDTDNQNNAGQSAFNRKPAVSLWLENPAPLINSMLGELSYLIQIPAQELFISIELSTGPNGDSTASPINPELLDVTAERTTEKTAEEALGQYHQEKQYQAAIQMQFAGVSQARGIAGAFSLARNFMGNFQTDDLENDNIMIFKLFFANPPVLEGQSIFVKTGYLTGSEISLLFGMFLLN